MERYFILGLLYSCGSLKSKTRFELQTKDSQLADLVFRSLSPLEVPRKERKEKYNLVILNGKGLENYLNELGITSFNKSNVPLEIIDSKDKRLNFLKGYFEGKSSLSVKGRIIKISGKKATLEKIKVLLDLEGLDGRIYKNKDYFSLYIEGKAKNEYFKKKIGFVSESKKKKLDKITSFGI